VEWIGVIRNEGREPVDEGWGHVVSEVVLDEGLTDGMDGIESFSHVLTRKIHEHVEQNARQRR